MSNQNFEDHSPQISLGEQKDLQQRFTEIASMLDTVAFNGVPDENADEAKYKEHDYLLQGEPDLDQEEEADEAQEITGTVDFNRQARFSFDKGSVVVSIFQTLGSGYRQMEHRVERYGVPSLAADGDWERSVEVFAVEKFDTYDPKAKSSPEDPEGKPATESDVPPEYSRIKRTQRWVGLGAANAGHWENKTIDDNPKSSGDDSFGQDDFYEMMGVLNRTLDSDKIPFADTSSPS